MKTKEIQEIQQLIDRFFDGETSIEEERRLYDFFGRNNIPAELVKYKEMFMDFAAVATDSEAVSQPPSSKPAAKSHTPWRIIFRITKAAAVVLVLVVGTLTYVNYHEQQQLSALYGGSYVIENGKRIDDLRQIRHEIESTLSEAQHIEAHATEASVANKVKKDLLNSISDADERAEIEQLLNE